MLSSLHRRAASASCSESVISAGDSSSNDIRRNNCTSSSSAKLDVTLSASLVLRTGDMDRGVRGDEGSVEIGDRVVKETDDGNEDGVLVDSSPAGMSPLRDIREKCSTSSSSIRHRGPSASWVQEVDAMLAGVVSEEGVLETGGEVVGDTDEVVDEDPVSATVLCAGESALFGVVLGLCITAEGKV